ncbi:MAG: N-6 DNA methylase [Candidatus Lokiarchaeota archaeon]|nr:N-6 DNA methylase [Candidatus Lokiarchaeota archaeon]MBD3199983.1 N-6 DNA methylase [Candidatus Lokiarchaeota archaeon]
MKKNQDLPEKKLQIGQVFTPDYVAKFMVKILINVLKNTDRDKSLKYVFHNKSVLEPCAGEGIFIKELKEVGFSNIIAYELDNGLVNALQSQFPGVEIRGKNFLGSDLNEKFDVIIGNPPYLGQNYNSSLFQEYCNKFQICSDYFVGNMDLFYYWIHLGIEKLKPGGILSYITTHYWITKSEKTGIVHLKPHILNECYLLWYIDLSNLTIFQNAKGQHNCIFFLQKKKELEKKKKDDRHIQIISFEKNKIESNLNDEEYNRKAFKTYFSNNNSLYKQYVSTTTNNELKTKGNWNLLIPKEVKQFVNEIEKFCKYEGTIMLLKDIFMIRNGLIFIKDNIFILKSGKNILKKNDGFYIKIADNFKKINKSEESRLKKIYKGRSIKPYGYKSMDYEGYAIYFNKDEINTANHEKTKSFLKKKYPIIVEYLYQYKDQLEKLLINAKENPKNIFFPRRGSRIKVFNSENKANIQNLEPYYETRSKIFFKYILKENTFGYSNDPYYATSDTYFMWLKTNTFNLNYPFILAYLNSKIVKFLFKAKNIKIKRSKTKLEYGLPVLNDKLFHSEKEKAIISLIEILGSLMIRLNSCIASFNLEERDELLLKVKPFQKHIDFSLEKTLIKFSSNETKQVIQKLIDKLFLVLLKLDGDEMEYLINSYYSE